MFHRVVTWAGVDRPVDAVLLARRRLIENALSRPFALVPRDIRWQCADSDEFAGFVVSCVEDGHRGERVDFAGPEVLTLREMAEQLTAAREVDRRIHELPLPGRVERALTTGNTSASGHRGTTTWAEWLARGSAPPAVRIAA